MTPFFGLIAQSQSAYLDPPQGWIGWVGFIFLFSLILWLAWKWRRFNTAFEVRQRLMLAAFLLLALITSLLLGVRLAGLQTTPPPGIPVEPTAPLVMLFAALPFMLAGGILGPAAAGLVGLISGSLAALWQTHNPFTLLEMALLGVMFGAAMRQRFRTPLYRFLRRPFLCALLLSLFYPFLHILTTPFTAQGLLVARLDYAITNLRSESLAWIIELLIGGLACELIAALRPQTWGSRGDFEPSPAEQSLQTRFLVSLSPLALVLVTTLVLGDWIVAGQAARSMLRAQMANAAEMASETVPYFLETGQNLILQLAASPSLMADDSDSVSQALSQQIKSVPFFNQLSVIDLAGDSVASYPTSNYVGKQAPVEEQMGIQMVLNGVPFQAFTIPPSADQTTAQVSFVAAIPGADGKPARALVGRSDLASNPYTQPILTSLSNLAGVEGQGMLLDENGRILVHPDPQRVMTTYDGQTADEPLFYDGVAWDGTRQLFFYQPAKGRPWAIVLTVPAYRAQQIALSIAAPLLGMIVLLTLLATLLVRLSLSVVTHSLEKLTGEAGRLAEGRLDRPISVESADEVGQLGRAFEQMRISLKARLDELNRLLLVSQGVASSLEIGEAIQPVLESALASGSAVRVVLTPAVLPELDGKVSAPISFGQGPSGNLYRDLDEQILALTRQQDRLVLSNLYRPRLLNLAPGAPHPESLMAVALKHENNYYGALWVAYDQPHNFSEEEVRFLATLGGQAALAAANARLFMTAEIGRRRLDSILASSPDPMLVIDQRDCLLLANPAAWQVLGLGVGAGDGQTDGAPIDQVVSESALLDLLRASSAEKHSTEITLPDGRIFLATATPVLAEGQRVGRVCVMRDVTHFKELDALKSEFVSTVSHDLRSPLTLMRGYATMLEMVGQLNEQQTNYVRKIVGGVESMSRLVNNLLNLGRIEAGVGLLLEMIPVQDVVERVVSGLQLSAAQKHIQLSVEIPKQTIPLIEADQALLQQALQNLVENAIKFTRPEGKIVVRVQAQAIGMVFQVSDNGVGISPMDMPRLFEKFYRGAQQGMGDTRGTGLGLAIVKSIAERHGGRAWAESQLGKGSTFYLAIPLRQPKAAERAEA